METFKIEFTVTILIYLTPITISEDFEVYRPKPPSEDGWIFGTDSFKIPPSLCNQGGMNCAHFNACTNSACHCSCPYSAATFMFDRNDWRCLTNLQTREQLGYNPTHYFVFESERLNNPIRLVYFSDYRRVSLPSSLKNCRVDVGSSWYIGCKGLEVSFNNSKLFSIVPDGDPRDSPPYFLKVESAASNTKLLEGRIIKLGVVCNGPVNRWLLFKYAGNIKCLAPTLPPKTTTKPGERKLKLFPSQGTGMAGNTVIDLKLEPSASLSMPVDYATKPNGFDFRPTVSDVRPTVNDVQPTVFDFRLTTPTRTGREQGSDDSSSSQGLIAGLTASILAVFVIIGFFAYRRGYLTKMKKPKLPPKKRAKRDSTTSVNTQSTSGSKDGEDKYRTPDIKQASIHYASTYVVPSRDHPRLEYASSTLPVGLNSHCHDNRAGTQHSVYKAVYKDPNCDSDLRSTKKGQVCADQPVYNQMEELSVRGPPLGSVQEHDNGTTQPGSHLTVPVRHQTYAHAKTLESAGYRDPDFDSELRSKLKCPIRAERPVYNHVEELSVRGATEPAKGRYNGSKQPVCTAVYKDPDFDSELRSKLKGPVRAEQPVYNHVEELSMQEATGPAKGRDSGTQQPVCKAVYKDPDLDSKLRPKKKGRVCVQQPVYNHVEDFSVRGTKRPAKGPTKSPDNGNQQPVFTAVYKDPDLDKELRPKKKGPVCVQQPVYNRVEELPVRETKGPVKGPDNSNQQPLYTAVYKDPDLDKELRPKKKGPVCVQQPVYNHVEELLVREAKGPAKGPDNGNQQPVFTAVYKDPDLDQELRPKKKGPVCVQQPVFNHVEDLLVRETKGPVKGPDNGNQQPLYTVVYKDPDLDKELRPKKKGPVCVQQPVYNHIEELSVPGTKGPANGRENDTQPEYNVLESYLECSRRPSQYGTMMSSAELVFNTMKKSKPDDTKQPNDS